jgi:hypothetical protein
MEHIYYTYIYLDPRKSGKYEYDSLNQCFLYEPFYIGKGKDNRATAHLLPYSLKQKSYKNAKIKAIKNCGLNPLYVKYLDGITEAEAIKQEIILIEKIGRHNISGGTLTNLTDGGDGVTNAIIESTRKKVDMVCVKTKKVLKTYDSITEAATENIILVTGISSCCTNKSVTAGGYHWKFHNADFKARNRNKTRIAKYDINYNLMTVYESGKEAAQENGVAYTSIYNNCYGKTGECSGYIYELYDLDEETKQEYRIKRNAINSNTEKPIRKICKMTGKVTDYNSMNDAASDNNITPSMINFLCKGKRGKQLSYKMYYINDRRYDDQIEFHHNEQYLQKKPILQMDLNGNNIREFSSIPDAISEIGGTKTSLRKACQYNRIYKNHYWKYKNSEHNIKQKEVLTPELLVATLNEKKVNSGGLLAFLKTRYDFKSYLDEYFNTHINTQYDVNTLQKTWHITTGDWDSKLCKCGKIRGWLGIANGWRKTCGNRKCLK